MIRLRGDSFVFVDELAYFKNIYSPEFEPKKVFYELDTPFLMDSQVESINRNGDVRHRKRKAPVNNAPQFLLMNCAYVHGNYKKFLSAMQLAERGTQILDNENNKQVREAVKNAPSSQQPRLTDSASLECVELNSNHDASSSNSVQYFDCYLPTLFKNKADHSILVRDETSGREFVIPMNSEFINGDVKMLRHLIHREIKFDLIIIDPPWPNKSVKRKKNYQIYEDMGDLSLLTINDLLNDNGLVCIWLSNNENVHSRTRAILSEQWSMTELATWHWLKLCRSEYKPVVEFKPEHKVPFESLLLACKKGVEDHFRNISDTTNFTIISVPNANPSRKPPIGPILQELELHNSSKSLEIFSRYLLPGTLSIGNETINFQDLYFFDIKENTSEDVK